MKQDDIVNMGMAKMADAPVLLVGDIDRAVFLHSFMELLCCLIMRKSREFKGTIINKFRGDDGNPASRT